MNLINKETLAHYNFREVSPDELITLRMEDQPGFILMQDNTCYCSSISDGLALLSKVMLPTRHFCANCHRACATEYCDGGCAKVKDPFLKASCQKFGIPVNKIDGISESADPEQSYIAVEESKRIEKYPFIQLGYEIFNAPSSLNNKFIVLECSCYEKYLSA